MKIELKICGMRTRENILEVVPMAPDYMGFIFFRGSRRFVGNDFEIPEVVDSKVKRVGVFVNESSKEIFRLANIHGLSFAQLHGNETKEQCTELAASGLKLIKVFSIGNDFDFSQLNPFKKRVDYFLFDTKGDYYGGNGVPFNWSILRKYDQEVPFFLSGGIAPQNVSGIESLRGMNLHAVDINSGVERLLGIKDVSLIKTLKKGIKELNSQRIKE